MLKSLIDGTTHSNFVLIKDNENCSGLQLFNAFLVNHASNKSFEKINMICYENPPDYYHLPQTLSEKVTAHNYFSDPLNWNNDSGSKTDLSAFTINPQDHAKAIFFIDSLSCLIMYHKLYTVYKNLTCLKNAGVKIIALIHSDLFTSSDIEELELLPGTIVELHECVYTKDMTEKTVVVTHKKPNGKVLNQTEIVTIENDWKITSRKKIEEKSCKTGPKVTDAIQSLATFKLGFDMSENEKKARDELVLPYLKTDTGSGGGEIFYEPEADELEEDPDDDLDI